MNERTASEIAIVEQIADQFRGVLKHFFARRVRQTQEVDDLVQEVFVRLLKRGRLEDLADHRAYLFETAANVLIDRARRRRSHRAGAHEAFDTRWHGCEDFSIDRVLMGEEALASASRAILGLPEPTRTVFIMRRLEGFRLQDIALRLGISLSLVEKQMNRAVTHLRQRMNEESPRAH